MSCLALQRIRVKDMNVAARNRAALPVRIGTYCPPDASMALNKRAETESDKKL